MKSQDGATGTMTARQLYAKEPFRVGLIAGMTKQRAFLPDLFYTGEWDQIYYERGYHFSAYLKSQGKRISNAPKTPPKELLEALNQAFKVKAIL